MIISLKQREIKFKPRIKLDHNITNDFLYARTSKTYEKESPYNETSF